MLNDDDEDDEDAGEDGEEAADNKNKDHVGGVPKDIAKIMRRAEKAHVKAEKKGVVYLSSVPPFMNPTSLRRLMERHFNDDVERIYMEPEREHSRRNRMKSGGNRKLKYVEAWVEFNTKKRAKECADLLNLQPIGGKKRHNLFHDDLWNIKYLSGFKWSHLTEKLAYDAKVREQRLQGELSMARKVYQAYEEKRALGKKLARIEKQREKEDSKLEAKKAKLEAMGDTDELSRIEQKKQKNLEKMYRYQQRK